MLEKVGFALIMLGGMAADSDVILAPILVVTAGVVMMLIGIRREERHERD